MKFFQYFQLILIEQQFTFQQELNEQLFAFLLEFNIFNELTREVNV